MAINEPRAERRSAHDSERRDVTPKGAAVRRIIEEADNQHVMYGGGPNSDTMLRADLARLIALGFEEGFLAGQRMVVDEIAVPPS